MSVAVITRSFAFMEYRKMRRSLFGLYPEKGRVTLFWGLAYFAVLCTLVGLEHAGWQPANGIQLRWDVDDVCFGGLLTLVMLLTATKTGDVIRFCLYWAYVAVMVLLLTDGLHVVGARRDAPGGEDVRSDNARSDDARRAGTVAADAADADADADADASLPTWSSHALRHRLLCALVAAEAITLVTWYLIHHVMPAAVLTLVSQADLRLWWNVEVLAPEASCDGGNGLEDGGVSHP